MNIEYKDTHEFTLKALEELFLSVEWSSGHFPDKLVVAMKNKDCLRIAVIAVDEETHFYEQCGFVKSEVSSPMFITSLWT